MKLFVMRHGSAEDAAPSGIDGDRALTATGRKRVRHVAKALVDLDEAPSHIVSSPLVRAVQTAEIVALVTSTKLEDHGGSVEIRRELSPGGEGSALVRSLLASGGKRVMVVGHEPDLSGLVESLLGTFDRPLEKAMVVGLQLRHREAKESGSSSPRARLAGADGPRARLSREIDGSRARLRFVLDPRTLALDPDARDVTD
jgi:phosphohistidine phosphatase